MKVVLLLSLILMSCSSPTLKTREYGAEIKRGPSAITTNYTCFKLLSLLFENPYKKTYQLKSFPSFQAAKEAFEDSIDATSHQVKIGSQAFMRLQTTQKEAPTVVLVHGYSDSPGSMRTLADMYYERGFHVIAPRLNDHGLNPELQINALAKSSLDRWREDLDFALAVAHKLSGDKYGVHAAGYSMGSSLIMDASWRHVGLIRSRTLYAPLFKENGFVPQFMLWILELFKKVFNKQVDETDTFYKVMSYRQTIEMHRLTRQIQPHVLRQRDNIPTAVFRVDPSSEHTVDDDFIDAFVDAYGLNHHYTYQNPEGITDPVLHRDLTAPRINSSDRENPALETIWGGLQEFFDSLEAF